MAAYVNERELRMSEYDSRQQKLMLEKIHEFEAGKLQLITLIDDLAGLLDCLEATDQSWKNEFRAEWWTLEQVYAVALDRGHKTLSEENQRFVTEALANMKGLLERFQTPKD